MQLRKKKSTMYFNFFGGKAYKTEMVRVFLCFLKHVWMGSLNLQYGAHGFHILKLRVPHKVVCQAAKEKVTQNALKTLNSMEF